MLPLVLFRSFACHVGSPECASALDAEVAALACCVAVRLVARERSVMSKSPLVAYG